MKTITPERFTRIKNDVNGNPRYVCHFLALDVYGPGNSDGYSSGECYALACKLGNKAGGRKYHNKIYGGGIVFQSYSLDELCSHLNALLAEHS